MIRKTYRMDIDGHSDVGLRRVYTVGDAICALADYEDTGLAPEEIKTQKVGGAADMIPKATPDVLDAYIKKYGDLQLVVACEEMSELQKELCKALRGKPDVDHTAEEISDVEIMLEQVKRMYDCAGAVEAWKRKKLVRMEERMESDGK